MQRLWFTTQPRQAFYSTIALNCERSQASKPSWMGSGVLYKVSKVLNGGKPAGFDLHATMGFGLYYLDIFDEEEWHTLGQLSYGGFADTAAVAAFITSEMGLKIEEVKGLQHVGTNYGTFHNFRCLAYLILQASS